MRRQLGVAVAATTAICLAVPATAARADEVGPTHSSPTLAQGSNLGSTQVLPEQPPVTELIVKYKSGVKPTEAPGVATGDRSVDEVDLEPGRKMSLGLRTVEMSQELPAQDAAAVARELERDPRVESATPNFRVYPAADVGARSTTSPTDPFFQTGDMWGLSGAYGIGGPTAWAVTTGSSGVVVAVLDTGIRSHPDLAGASQVAGYDMISDTAKANDGDGRDADPSDPGDWVTESESESEEFLGCIPGGSSWHGTHVAGTVNAASNNGVGVASVAPGVKVQPVRVLGKCGGTIADVVDGISWASGGTVPDAGANPTPASVINMSLGGGGVCDDLTQSAIDAAVARGTTVVVAAGNDSVNAAGATPASCANVVTVAATNSLGKRALFSNYGSNVDLGAPGTGIWSTSNTGSTTPVSATYERMDGTSMAAPHVAGLAALLKSVQPAMTPVQVEARLKDTTTRYPGGKCDSSVTCGTGIANAAAVTGQAASPAFAPSRPGRVRTIKISYNGARATVKWTAPTEDGGASISGYHYRVSKNGGKSWSGWSWTGSKKKSIIRKAGAKHVLQVAPLNVAGRGNAVKAYLKRR